MSNKLIAVLVTVGIVAGIFLLLKFGPAAGTSSERGLLLYLPFGKDMKDHSRFGRAVTVTGQVHLEDGVARFPGKGSWLSVEHIPIDGRPFAVSMWIKPVGPLNQGLLAQRDADTENHHLHLALSNGRPYFAFYENDARARRVLGYDVWNHVVFVFDGREQQVWLNGEAIVHSSSKVYLGQRGDTSIGRHLDFPYLHAADFQGWMCEVRVYEGLFEPERVLALYRRGLAGS